MKRLVDVRGTTPKLSVEVGLSTARAALRLLQLHAEGDLGEQVVLCDGSTAYVHRLGAERLLGSLSLAPYGPRAPSQLLCSR
eukprot:scaffold42284_cov40-Phaeocystis_antarctica.AAC.2